MDDRTVDGQGRIHADELTRPGAIVVYTAIFGEIRDQLQPITVRNPQARYVAFTDARPPGPYNGWDVRAALWQHRNTRLRARHHKLLPQALFPEASYSLWLDGCFTPTVDPADLIRTYLVDCDMVLFRHSERRCVYRELEACTLLQKDDPTVMRRQVERYRQEGLPENIGLVETGALLRRHSPQIEAFNQAWWKELYANSIRDQLSFNYVAWKLGTQFVYFQGLRVGSPYFAWRPHR